MADYYVNLNSPATGGVGSAVDPYGVQEYIGRCTDAGPHNFYLRGMGTLAANLVCGGPHTHQAWDLAPCGSTYRTTPWRLLSGGAFTASWAGGTISDAVLQVIAGATGPTTSIRVAYVTLCPEHGALGVPGVMTNCTVIGAVAVFRDGGTVTRCVFSYFGGGGGQTVNLNAGGVALTHVNNVTWRAVGVFWVGANNVDGGGQLYSCAFQTAPAWNDADQMLFNQFAHRGVGAGNSWAEPMPTYTDIAAAFDDTTPREATAALPATFADWSAHVSPPLGVRTHNLGGSRVLTAGIGPAYPWGNQTFDGYDLTDPTAHEAWIVDGYGFQMTFAAFDGNSTVFKRLAIRQGTLGFNPAGNNYNFRFYNCYLRHQTQIQIQQGRPINMYFYGCTVYTPLLFMHDSGSCTYRWDHCVFFDTVCGSSGDADVVFYKCRFNKTKAEIKAAMMGEVTFTDCTFSANVYRYPPEVVDVNATTMNFFLYGIPQTDDSTEWSSYDHGFDDDARLGIGAFYFGAAAPTVEIDASAESGASPLTTEFSAETDPVGAPIDTWSWNFGDGITSDQSSPEHTYEEPGTYTVTCTVVGVGGFTATDTITVYVYDQDYSSGYVVTETDYCARMAIEEQPAQGVGWSEYGGSGWPMPLGNVGSCEVIDNVDDQRVLVMDSVTFKVHELGVVDLWRDAETDYGGIEQEAEILWPEEVPATRAVAKLEHTQSHLYVKPWYKDRRSEGDYGADGYRPDFEMDMFLRQNALPTDAAITRAVPVDGQLTVDRHFATGYLQMGCRLRTAPWRLTGAELWVREIDTGGSPAEKRMTELKYADEWAEPHFWFSRGYPILNRATGQDATATYAGTIVGPDLYSNSGVVLAAGQSYEATLLHDLTGGFTFNVWLRAVTEPSTILRSVSQFWRIDMTHDGALRYQDDSNDLRIELARGWGAWRMLTVARSGEHIAVYSNGELVMMYRMHYAYTRYSGDLVLFEDGMAFFDARLVARTVSAEGIKYLYRDILENRGNATCPAA
jgi:PKD repeat protein